VQGKKEGEIRVFRNGMVPEAYMWQGGKWVKIGDVITEGGDAPPKAEPRYYQGDKYFEAGLYDYVFDVDDESGVPKVIPFNDGANPMEAAEKYCMR
jgi:phospholipase A-2-activating protein